MLRCRLHPNVMKLNKLFLYTFGLCLGLAAKAGTVRSINGESYDGKVQLEGNQITYTPPQGGAVVRINSPDIFEAIIHPEFASKADMLPPGLLLVDGTLLPGSIAGLDQPSVKVGDYTLPMTSVAWVVVSPIQRDKLPKITPGQTGAILPNGDFFPGTIDGVKDNRVAVNSVLFGPQRFALKGKSQMAALVLRDFQNTARYEVVAKDGATYQVDDIKSEAGGLLLHDAVAGDVRIKADSVYAIRLSRACYQLITSLKPLQVDTPKGVDPKNALQTLTGTFGATTQDALLTAANTAISYTVPQGFTTFSSTIVLPKESAPPNVRFNFSIYADGRVSIYKSPSMAVGDSPQQIRATLNNAHFITIRVEPLVPGTVTASGKWIQPMLLKL